MIEIMLIILLIGNAFVTGFVMGDEDVYPQWYWIPIGILFAIPLFVVLKIWLTIKNNG